jgi:hypothetical protein
MYLLLFQRKRKSADLKKSRDDIERKKKATEELLAKAKVGKEETV